MITDGHRPAWRNGMIGCECGWKPAKPAARRSMQHVSHLAHRRKLKLQPVNYQWPDETYGVEGALSVGSYQKLAGHEWVDGQWIPRRSSPN